jgi:hypothetical protein
MKWLACFAALVVLPSAAVAECGDGDCYVGAYGQGGESSAGKAQGFRYEQPGTLFPDYTLTNTGNLNAGRYNVISNGSSIGSTSGTFRGTSVRGTFKGVFGDWAGQCEIEDMPDNC